MSFTYPLATADFWEATFIGPAVMDLYKPMRKTGSTRGGKVLMKIDGTAKWVGSATFAPHYNRDSIAMEARLRKLGAGGTFLAYDLRAPYPASDPDGSKLGNGSLVALGGEAAYGDVSLGAYRYEGHVVTLAQAASVVGDAGTYFDVAGVLQTSAANTLRIDHDPVTHAPLGILAETAFSNRLLRSREFDNAAWTKVRATITANATTDPWGTTLADKLVEDATAASTHFATQVHVVANYVNHVCYVLAKAAERTSFRLQLTNATTASAYASFDLATGVVSGVTSGAGDLTGASARMVNIGNGWYWCELEALKVIGDADCDAVIFLRDGSGNITYNGDGTSGLYLAHAQMEEGVIGHMPLVTTSAIVSRAVDTLTFRAKGTNSWTVTYDNDATVGPSSVAGNWAVSGASFSRPRLKRWSATRTTQPAAAAPEVESIGADNTSAALRKLPPFFKITMGDYISFPRTNGKRMLVQALEDAVANHLGVTDELQVEPPLRSGSIAGAAVTLIEAPAEFMIPDGWTAPTGDGPISDGMAFMFEESL